MNRLLGRLPFKLALVYNVASPADMEIDPEFLLGLETTLKVRRVRASHLSRKIALILVDR